MGAMMPGLNRIRQVSFRARIDNGSEAAPPPPTGADWLADLNENWTQIPNEKFRVRFLVERTAGTTRNAAMGLWYSHNGGVFTDISDVSSVIRSASTNHYATQSDTTQLIGTGTFVDATNGCAVAENPSPGFASITGVVNWLGALEEMETEWCLEIVRDDVVAGDTIELQGNDQFGSPVVFTDGYTNTPLITVQRRIFIT